MATRKSSCTSITDLNGDCMRRVFFYLRLIDRFKFALVCNNFDEIFASFLHKELFIMREFIQAFRVDELKQILERFGPYIKRISVRQKIDSSNIECYKLIPQYCHNIEAIELQRNLKATEEELHIYKSILWGVNKLRSVQVFQNTKLNRESISERELACYQFSGLTISLLISTLVGLKTLHYSDSSLHGEGLSNLRNLTELNIAYSNNFSSADFCEICQSVKLHTLNINNCSKLDNTALETLVETQTELRHLTISNNLLAHNYEVIGQLKSLKELILIDKNSKKLCELMSELANYHKDDLETLKISSSCILFSSDFRQNILSFRNLKVYYPSYVVMSDDEYLVGIGTKFPKLQKLKICVSSISTCNGFVYMLRLLVNLSELILDYTRGDEDKFSLNFLRKIIEVRRNMNSGLLTLHLLHGTVAHDVLWMTTIGATSLLSLNEDCLHHLSSFLSIKDILIFHLVSSIFDEIILNRLKTDTIITSLYRDQLSREHIKYIFEKFSPYIENLHIDEWINPFNIYFYELIGKEFPNVRSIELHYPSRLAIQVYADILSKARNTTKIVVRPDELNHVKGAVELNKLETKLCSIISNLTELNVLQLSNLDDITGEELTQLSSLKDLNIAHCYSFEQKNFLSICERNALKIINIAHCLLFDNTALQKLTELETLTSLTISDNLLANDYGTIADIKNLRELNFHIYEAVCLDGTVTKIVHNYRTQLEKLVVINDQLIANGVFNHFWPRILSFENLKILDISVDQGFGNWHFIEIGKYLRKLEELVLKFCDLSQYTFTLADLIEFLKFSKGIKVLTIYPHEFCTKHKYKSIKVRENSKTRSLSIDEYSATNYLIDSIDDATVVKIEILEVV